MSVKSPRVRLFLSYARADTEYHRELLTHLRPLSHLLDIWHDQQIQPGTDWKRAIDEALSSADLVLLLISPDFLASDFCVNTELQKAFDRWSRADVFIVPIVVRDCAWGETPIARLQVLCAEKPLGTHERRPTRDAEWRQVVHHLQVIASRALSVKTISGRVHADRAPPIERAVSLNRRTVAGANAGWIGAIRSLSLPARVLLLGQLPFSALGIVTIFGFLLGWVAVHPQSQTAGTEDRATEIGSSAPPAEDTRPTYIAADVALEDLGQRAAIAKLQCYSVSDTKAVALALRWLEDARTIFKQLATPGIISETDMVNNVLIRGLHQVEDPENQRECDLMLQKAVHYIENVRREARLRRNEFAARKQ